MKKVALDFTNRVDLILVPESIVSDIEKYQLMFDNWLYDKNNNHGHWILFDGEKVAVSFNTKTFVDFLNDHVLEEEKSIILKENAFIVSKRIPRLLF